MQIKFKYRGIPFTFDTPEAAAKTLALLEAQDAEAARQKHQARIQSMLNQGQTEELHQYLREGPETPWTPETFTSFIDRLGKAQRQALALLVNFHHVTDDEFRACLKVSGNQALAGVLSGISKQAAALNISARDIFSFENFRNAGKRRSTYTASDKFLQIASQMNWPGPEFLPKK